MGRMCKSFRHILKIDSLNLVGNGRLGSVDFHSSLDISIIIDLRLSWTDNVLITA